MSSNRLSYDACAYEKNLLQSTSPLDYMLYNGKYENSSKCRYEFGVVGGNGVSLFDGNLVDLESDLRGQTRQASLCPSKFYSPECKNCNNHGNGLPCSSNECKPKMMHQPSCQMQYYPKTPLAQPSKVTGCNYKENQIIESFRNTSVRDRCYQACDDTNRGCSAACSRISNKNDRTKCYNTCSTVHQACRSGCGHL